MEIAKPPGHGHPVELALHRIYQNLLPVSSRKVDMVACVARRPAGADPGASETLDT